MIEIINLTKYYDNFRALDNINLKVEKGEILGLLGPNGAGKTTAMRILSCFIPATSGTAKVAGYDVFDDSIEVRRRLGYLPETPPVYQDMTVLSYLDFVGRIRELSGKNLTDRINIVSERLGLVDYKNRIIGTLSKGYRQRVGLAQAMIHNPEVLILDEPTVGLDPNQIIEIRELIKDLANDHTVILSTHILSEVSASCNRVVIINEGTIVAEDSVENIQNMTIGKPSWHIAVKTPKKDLIQQASESINYCEISDLSEKEGFISFTLKLSNKNDFDSFFTRLASQNVIFKEIIPVKASLEDVFIKLTNSEVNENKIINEGSSSNTKEANETKDTSATSENTEERKEEK